MPVRRLLPVALGALLTACSPTTLDDAPPAPTPEPAPVLELGDFDPAGDFAVFDPCTEIPPEVLAGAGLVLPLGDSTRDGERSVLCSTSLKQSPDKGVMLLSGDRYPRERIQEMDLLLAAEVQPSIRGAYLHTLPGDTGSDCYAAVHTTRGRFVVSYNEPLTSSDRAYFCEKATNTLEFIIRHLGESNGNSDRS